MSTGHTIINNTQFAYNTDVAISASSVTKSDSLVIDRSLFQNNQVANSGVKVNTLNLQIYNSKFDTNMGAMDSGGYLSLNNVDLMMDSCT